MNKKPLLKSINTPSSISIGLGKSLFNFSKIHVDSGTRIVCLKLAKECASLSTVIPAHQIRVLMRWNQIRVLILN